MIKYNLIWEGIDSHLFYEDNNILYTVETQYCPSLKSNFEYRLYERYYCQGKIQVINNKPFGLEYSTPIMRCHSWRYLEEWLMTLNTKKVLTLSEIFDTFESETKHEIEWFIEEGSCGD